MTTQEIETAHTSASEASVPMQTLSRREALVADARLFTLQRRLEAAERALHLSTAQTFDQCFDTMVEALTAIFHEPANSVDGLRIKVRLAVRDMHGNMPASPEQVYRGLAETIGLDDAHYIESFWADLERITARVS
jgi:hypothetical protein